MTIIIDADAFIGLKNTNDPHHQTTTDLLHQVSHHKPQLYTAWDVVSETAARLAYNISREQCVSFLDFIQKGPIKVLYPTNKRASQAIEKRRNISTKNVSLTDCMNMILADEFSVDYIFSFDKIYTKHNYKLLKEYDFSKGE